MTLLADSPCVGGEASADYWSTSEENHETEGHCRRTIYTVLGQTDRGQLLVTVYNCRLMLLAHAFCKNISSVEYLPLVHHAAPIHSVSQHISFSILLPYLGVQRIG